MNNLEIGQAGPVVDAHKSGPLFDHGGPGGGPVNGADAASDQPGNAADEWHSGHEHLRARQAGGLHCGLPWR